MNGVKEYIVPVHDTDWDEFKKRIGFIRTKPELIRCKDCKHRPTIDGEYENGFDVVFPDMRCPCQCDDGWYNWMPEDDWYCANAKRRGEE